ncbi:MAG: hypothetical protein GX166_01980 [Clostridiaceae bacterium]|nr:hypothetical protein [Clostridiaceae bacterium]
MKDRNNKQMLVTASVLSLLNILIIKLFGLDSFSFERTSPIFAYIFSFSYAIVHIIICHILRYKRKQGILKGIFLYQLVGASCFVILFVFLLTGNEVGFLRTIFNWWSLPLEPISLILSLYGFFAKGIFRGIVYLAHTAITGNAYVQIKKDITFENRMKEKKAMEEESRRRQEQSGS